MSAIIVNADDYGYSFDMNRAIAESFHRGLCSTASVMASMPAFEAACEAADREGFRDRLGVHFVLTEGEPLTQSMRKCPRFCDATGRFRLTRKERVWRLDSSETAALAEELRAQIVRCRRFGLPLPHADSHQHVHEEWGILPVVMRVCHEEGISQIRVARNCGKSTGLVRTLYRAGVNHILRRQGMARTDLFGSLADFQALLRARPGVCNDHSVEVMIHPRCSADGRMLDRTPPEVSLSLLEQWPLDRLSAKAARSGHL